MNQIDDSVKLDISLNETFFLLGNAIAHLKEEHRSSILMKFADNIKNRFQLGKEEVKEAIKIGGHDFKEPQKVIVATRMVPVSHPEEMGENGLMWTDVRR